MFKLPSRPKKAVETPPLAEQIEAAKKQSLFALSPPTVGKHVAAIKSLLAIARESGWVQTNAAEGVVVEGAKHQGTERDHSTDGETRCIYGSALMTDPDACSDTLFWILFLAPFHGPQPGELGKRKPGDVVEDDGGWVMRIRADWRRRRASAASPEEQRPRRTKTAGSQRDVPVQGIVVLGGFIDLAQFQREHGAEWLFDDLKPDKFDDRYRYLSKQINGALPKLGITAPDKAFYSTRHRMKREGRRRGVHEQNPRSDRRACHNRHGWQIRAMRAVEHDQAGYRPLGVPVGGVGSGSGLRREAGSAQAVPLLADVRLVLAA